MDQKFWLESSTIRGILVASLPIVTNLLKIFDIEVQDQESSSIVDGILSIVGMIGVIYAIIGRFKANKPLKN